MKLVRFLRGEVRVRATGDTAAVLSRLQAASLPVYDLSPEPGALRFSLPPRAFVRARPVLRRAHARLHILKKRGLPFWVRRHRRRPILALGALFFLALVVLCSQFIWEIRLTGSPPEREAALAVLRSAGLYEGCFRPGVDATAVEQALLSSDLGLSFASVVFRGSVAEVDLALAASPPPLSKETPCHLVAARAGVVRAMEITEGTPAVSVGESVEPGQILVRGEWLDDEGNSVRRAHAAGRVWAYCPESYEVFVPFEEEASFLTGRETEVFRLKIFTFSFNLYFGGGIPYEEYDKIEQEEHAAIGSFLLPVSRIRVTARERAVQRRSFSAEQARAEAESRLEETVSLAAFGQDFRETERVWEESETGITLISRGVTTRLIAVEQAWE